MTQMLSMETLLYHAGIRKRCLTRSQALPSQARETIVQRLGSENITCRGLRDFPFEEVHGRRADEPGGEAVRGMTFPVGFPAWRNRSVTGVGQREEHRTPDRLQSRVATQSGSQRGLGQGLSFAAFHLPPVTDRFPVRQLFVLTDSNNPVIFLTHIKNGVTHDRSPQRCFARSTREYHAGF